MSKPSQALLFFSILIWVGSAINRLKRQAVNLKDGGSSPSLPANCPVAQWSEHFADTEGAEGSNPSGTTRSVRGQ